MSEARVMALLVGAIMLFIMSLFMSFTELRYAISGKEVAARVTGKVPLAYKGSRRSATRTVYEVTGVFDDGGNERKETVTVEQDFPFAEDGTIALQYLPGSVGMSRVAGTTNMFWVYVMLACMAMMGFLGWRFWKFYKS